MFPKAILLLVLATVAVQAFVPYDANEQLEIYNQYGEGILDKLKEIIDKAIATAKDMLSNLFDDIVKKAHEMVKQAEELLERELKRMFEELDKIKEEAKKLGVNIVDCLKDNEEELKNLPKKYGEKIIHCGDEIIDKAKSVVDDSKKTVEDSIEIVKNLTAEFDACGNSWTSAVCKAGVAVKIGKAIVEVPVNIYQIASSAAPTILGFVPILEACVIKNTQDFLNEGETILTAINDCVQAKIHSSTASEPTSSSSPPTSTTESSSASPSTTESTSVSPSTTESTSVSPSTSESTSEPTSASSTTASTAAPTQ